MTSPLDNGPDAHRLDTQLLSDLWIFRSAARFGSISAAARRLGVTQSAVSQRVLRLEARLNTSLFVRNKVRLTLTDTGTTLLQAMSNVANVLNDSISRIHQNRRGAIVLSCVPSLATEWLVPHLDSFYRSHPGIEIFLRSELKSWTPERLDDEGVDLAIDYTPEPLEGLHELASVCEIIFPVCSRAYLENLRPGEPAQIVLLHDDFPQAGGSPGLEWGDWRRAANTSWPESAVADRHFNLSILAYHAAMCGQGVAMGRAAIVQRLVSRGELVAATLYAPVPGPSYRVVTHRPGEARSPVRLFAEWWARTMTETQAQMLSLLGPSAKQCDPLPELMALPGFSNCNGELRVMR
ncbi:MAG: LysR substrate-binding domain-containing protein [Gammaproteobacteria bacterium]